MKVLQVVKTNRGAAWAYNQAIELTKMGVDIVTIIPDYNLGYAKEYKNSGLRIIKGDWSLPLLRPWNIIKKIKEINQIISEEKPDLIHLHL